VLKRGDVLAISVQHRAGQCMYSRRRPAAVSSAKHRFVGVHMAAISGLKPDIEEKSQVFRFFISYAREDEKIAIAVSNALQTAMGLPLRFLSIAACALA